MNAAPLSERRSVVVISDWVEGGPSAEATHAPAEGRSPRAAMHWSSLPAADRPWPKDSTGLPRGPMVEGGYLERLPLALVAAGVAEQAEIWHHWQGEGEPSFRRDSPWLARRAFRLDAPEAPFAGARAAGSEIIWDLLHYGWPDDLDI